jgi:hypothetical protein
MLLVKLMTDDLLSTLLVYLFFLSRTYRHSKLAHEIKSK